MLWAIDVGNTDTVAGAFDGDWIAIERFPTAETRYEQLPGPPSGVVVSGRNSHRWQELAVRNFGIEAVVLSTGAQVGLEVLYDPPNAVGSDRIANALAARANYGAPVVAVDFGTATTFDVVDSGGRFVGGAILPGLKTAAASLSQAAALPTAPIEAPDHAIGASTVAAIQSGVVLGHAGAVDLIASRIAAELGGNTAFVATGGLAPVVIPLCSTPLTYDPNLTLDGLVLAYRAITGGL